RLACVKHAASVRSEPGSNSQVHPSAPEGTPKRTARTRSLRSVCQRIRKTHQQTPQTNQIRHIASPTKVRTTMSQSRTQPKGAANVSLPIPDAIVKQQTS